MINKTNYDQYYTIVPVNAIIGRRQPQMLKKGPSENPYDRPIAEYYINERRTLDIDLPKIIRHITNAKHATPTQSADLSYLEGTTTYGDLLVDFEISIDLLEIGVTDTNHNTYIRIDVEIGSILDCYYGDMTIENRWTSDEDILILIRQLKYLKYFFEHTQTRLTRESSRKWNLFITLVSISGTIVGTALLTKLFDWMWPVIQEIDGFLHVMPIL